MITVIADDFSGAVEIGGIGLRYGLNTSVMTEAFGDTNDDLIIIDTNTRSGSASVAVERTKEITGQVMTMKPEWIYKKSDSVLRGHVLTEVEAMAEVLGKRSVLIIPANPRMRRTVKNGLYYINNKLLHTTDFAYDFEYPARSSNVIDLLGTPSILNLISMQSPGSLPDNTIVVGDSESEADLFKWAVTVDEQSNILTGAAAFFASLLEARGFRKSPADCIEQYSLNTPCLMVCGSTSAYSRKTLTTARKRGIQVYNITGFTTPSEKITSDYMERRVDEILNILIRHKSIIITTFDGLNSGNYTYRLFADIIEKVLSVTNIRELFIEGGTTASTIVRRMCWKRFKPYSELIPGVIRMSILNEPKLHITVKPGSYKWPDDIFEKLLY